MTGLLREFKGYFILGALVLLFVFWNKGINDERARQITNLTTKVEDQTKQIEGYKQEISELEQYKHVEQGLREIITAQSLEYNQLKTRHDSLRQQLNKEVAEMTIEQRESGMIIIHVWDLYEEMIQ